MIKILFIDLMKTGYDFKRCGIYNMSCIYCEQQDGQIKELDRLGLDIRPNDNLLIQERTLWTCGLTRSDLIHYMKESEALQRFIDFLDSKADKSKPNDKIYLAGYNIASLDMHFIKELFERNGNLNFRNYFFVQPLDLMIIGAYALMEKRNRMENMHIENVARAFGTEPEAEETYTTMKKSELCMEIYRKIQEKLKNQTR